MVLRGVLIAFSFILSAIDHSLPSFIAGVPQMSLGLANIVVLFALIFLGAKDAILITVVKSLFVIFLRGPISFLLSFTGGIFALTIEIILWKFSRKTVSLILLSALGGLAHNIGQIIAYSFYAQVNVSILYAPLSISGIITGILTAFVLRAMYPFMAKWFMKYKPYRGEGNN